MGIGVFLIVGNAARRWLIPFCSSGIRSATLAAISDFQGPRTARSTARAACAEVEPGGADLGAVERHKRVAPFDVLTQDDMNFAHDARSTRTHIELPIRVGLDHPDDRDAGRHSIKPRRLDRDLGLLEFEFRL